MTDMINCPHCQTKIPAVATHCRGCGAKYGYRSYFGVQSSLHAKPIAIFVGLTIALAVYGFGMEDAYVSMMVLPMLAFSAIFALKLSIELIINSSGKQWYR